MSTHEVQTRRQPWRSGVVLTAVLALLVAMTTVTAQAGPLADVNWETGGPDTTPDIVAGNPTCSQFSDEAEFKIEPVATGTYTASDAIITPSSAAADLAHVVVHIQTRNTADGQVFDYEIHGGVADVVVVKGGPQGNVYDYENPPGATPGPQSADDGLHAPVQSQDTYAGLSHISFCINPANPSTTLSVTTPASGAIMVYENDPVALSFTEENDGNVTLTDVHLTSDDAACELSMDPGSVTLNAGDSQAFTCTTSFATEGVYTVNVFGHGTYDGKDVTWNDACAAGTEDETLIICDDDEQASVTVTVLRPSTDLNLDNTLSDTTVVSGDSATLYFVEENDSDDNTPLTNVFVEVVEGPCASPLTLVDDADGDTTLSPGEKWVFSCTLTNVTAETTVKVVGHGETPLGDDVTWVAECDTGTQAADIFCDITEQAQATITVLTPSTSLTIDNGDGPISVPVGTPVELSFSETNDGDVDLEDPSVTVDNCTAVYDSGDDGDGILNVGETWVFTCDADTSVAGSTTYTATGSGFDPLGREVTFCGAGVNGDDGLGNFCDEDEQDSITIEVFEVGEGCTPGYWRNHHDSWAATGYSTGDLFDDVFGTNFDADLTLGEAIEQKGGKLNAVVRHITAALLNASHPDVGYAFTEAQVLQLWEDAQSDPQGVLGQIVPENEQGCPIN